jgi:methylenetetrahydrofolate dehydrogenase (NADP+)/methenyltetrahydrofolate cyclohydrolase
VSAAILDGKATAAAIRGELEARVKAFREAHGRAPGLTVVIVGEDPASQVYVKMKHRACEEIGMVSEVIRMRADTEEMELLAQIDQLNRASQVDGILVQMPVPDQIDSQRVIEAIDPGKDVDCFHPTNVGRMMTGDPAFLPCTPAGVVELLRRSGHTLQGKRVTVVGRSNIVGRPLAVMLTQRGLMADATVTVCHTKTANLAEACRGAEVLIAAVGRPNCITGDMIGEGAVVIDVGVNRVGDPDSPKGYRLVGDVDFDAAKEKAAAITPVPGGIGPMTIAMLLTNCLRAAEAHVSDL